jgi:hypothetical protein
MDSLVRSPLHQTKPLFLPRELPQELPRELPQELWYRIFTYLDRADLAECINAYPMWSSLIYNTRILYDCLTTEYTINKYIVSRTCIHMYYSIKSPSVQINKTYVFNMDDKHNLFIPNTSVLFPMAIYPIAIKNYSKFLDNKSDTFYFSNGQNADYLLRGTNVIHICKYDRHDSVTIILPTSPHLFKFLETLGQTMVDIINSFVNGLMHATID